MFHRLDSKFHALKFHLIALVRAVHLRHSFRPPLLIGFPEG